MRRRWKILIGVGVFLVLATGAVFASIPILTRKAREVIEARCAAAVGGTCEVGTIQFASDGALLTNVRVQNTVTEARATVARVSVRFRWWPLIWGTAQGVSVRATQVGLETDRTIDELMDEARRLRDARGASGSSGRASRMRIDRLTVEQVGFRVSTGMILRLRLEDASGEWVRDGNLQGRWAQASLDAGPLTTGSTGACTFRRDRGSPQLLLDCEGFTTQVDVDGSVTRAGALRQLLRAFRSRGGSLAGRRGGAADDGDGDDALPEALRGITEVVVRARRGRITVTRNERPIVTDLPAGFEVQIAGGHVTTVHASFGADASGPAVEADVARPVGQPWRLDLRADGVPLPEVARWVRAVPWHGVEEGRAHLRVRVEPGAQRGLITVDGELDVEQFGLMHPSLSREPIDGLTLRLSGAAEVDYLRRRISTEGARAGLNGVELALTGWAEHTHGRTAFDSTVRLATTSCDAIRRALPRSVTGPVNDLTFAGMVGADLRLALDTTNLPATVLDVRVADGCSVWRDGLPQGGIRRFARPFVQRVQEPGGLRAFVTGPGSAAWVPLGQISPAVVGAVITREDGGFYRHRGFNVHEIRGAIVRDVGARRFVYGASTLTMQLAKNVFLRREKTLVRKLQEVVMTWYLERSLDKDSIMELYLNVVEFGPGIYGIGPASRFYFGREPRDLTTLQAIYLATLLPNPGARYGAFLRGAVGADTQARLRGIARSMVAGHRLEPEAGAAAQTEVLAFRAAGTPVPPRATQNVDPATTDAQAESMSPGRYEAVAERGTEDDAPATDDSTDAPEEGPPEDPAPRPPGDIVPISLRTGGTI